MSRTNPRQAARDEAAFLWRRMWMHSLDMYPRSKELMYRLGFLMAGLPLDTDHYNRSLELAKDSLSAVCREAGKSYDEVTRQ